MPAIKTIFIGTPDFAVPSLKALSRDTDFQILTVITQPDMPAGRGLSMKKPAVKETAEILKYPVWQPEKIKEVTEDIRQLQPDVIVVAAYAQLIPSEILAIPRYGCINVHGSLLPNYRGAGVAQAPILNGDAETGATIMLMDKGLDTGPILAQNKITLTGAETAGELTSQLAELGGKMILPTVKQYIKGQLTPLPQAGESTYVGLIKKQAGLINWDKSAKEIERLVRAMSPWPGAWTWLKGKQVKIIEVDRETFDWNLYKPGKTFNYNGQLAIQCANEALIVKKIKLEGKNEISGEAFINGYRDEIGSILG